MTKKERTGKFFAASAMTLEGLTPTLLHAGSHYVPPLWFGGICQLLSFPAHAIGTVFFGKGTRRIPIRTVFQVVGVVFLTTVIPQSLLMLGTRLSTGINTALLVQAELPATVLISALFFREYLTSRQLFGMAIAIMGMVVVLWQPDAHIFGSPGEWMILASTVVVVFGNRCGKAVLTVLEPVEVLMIRSFCTGIIMIVASSFLAPSPVLSSLSSHIWLIIGAQTVFILILSKIFWYSALRRLRLVQAASFLPLSPFFAFIASALLLGERPTLFQIIGLLCIIAGLVLITTLYGERKSV